MLQSILPDGEMGVRGLLGFIKKNESSCAEYVDLVEVARQRGGIELLVDQTFEYKLEDNMFKSLSTSYGNPYVKLQGGEYLHVHEYLSKFVNDLKSLGIDLVFYFDGAKGTSTSGDEKKYETLKARHKWKMEKLSRLLEVCDGMRHVQRLDEKGNDKFIKPPLLETQVRETLNCLCEKRLCEVIYCTSGEADLIIAKHLRDRPKAYAILSSDADFCIFKDCKVIPDDLFDLQNELQVGGKQPMPSKPKWLEAAVVSSERVAEVLGVSSFFVHAA